MKRILSFALCLAFLPAACGPAPAAQTATPIASATFAASATLTPTPAPTETPTPEPLRLQDSIGEGNQNILSEDPTIQSQQLQELADKAIAATFGDDTSMILEGEPRFWAEGETNKRSKDYPFWYRPVGYKNGILIAESIIRNEDGTTDTVFTLVARQQKNKVPYVNVMALHLLVTQDMLERTEKSIDEIRLMLQNPESYYYPMLYLPFARPDDFYHGLNPEQIAMVEGLAAMPEFAYYEELLTARGFDFLNSDGSIILADPLQFALSNPTDPRYSEWLEYVENSLAPLLDIRP